MQNASNYTPKWTFMSDDPGSIWTVAYYQKVRQEQLNKIIENVKNIEQGDQMPNDGIVATSDLEACPSAFLDRLKAAGIINNIRLEGDKITFNIADNWNGALAFCGDLTSFKDPGSAKEPLLGNEILIELFEEFFDRLVEHNKEIIGANAAPLPNQQNIAKAEEAKFAAIPGNHEFLSFCGIQDMYALVGDYKNKKVSSQQALQVKVRALRIIAKIQKYYFEQVKRNNWDINDLDYGDRHCKLKNGRFARDGKAMDNLDSYIEGLEKYIAECEALLKEIEDKNKCNKICQDIKNTLTDWNEKGDNQWWISEHQGSLKLLNWSQSALHSKLMLYNNGLRVRLMHSPTLGAPSSFQQDNWNDEALSYCGNYNSLRPYVGYNLNYCLLNTHAINHKFFKKSDGKPDLSFFSGNQYFTLWGHVGLDNDLSKNKYPKWFVDEYSCCVDFKTDFPTIYYITKDGKLKWYKTGNGHYESFSDNDKNKTEITLCNSSVDKNNNVNDNKGHLDENLFNDCLVKAGNQYFITDENNKPQANLNTNYLNWHNARFQNNINNNVNNNVNNLIQINRIDQNNRNNQNINNINNQNQNNFNINNNNNGFNNMFQNNGGNNYGNNNMNRNNGGNYQNNYNINNRNQNVYGNNGYQQQNIRDINNAQQEMNHLFNNNNVNNPIQINRRDQNNFNNNNNNFNNNMNRNNRNNQNNYNNNNNGFNNNNNRHQNQNNVNNNNNVIQIMNNWLNNNANNNNNNRKQNSFNNNNNVHQMMGDLFNNDNYNQIQNNLLNNNNLFNNNDGQIVNNLLNNNNMNRNNVYSRNNLSNNQRNQGNGAQIRQLNNQRNNNNNNVNNNANNNNNNNMNRNNRNKQNNLSNNNNQNQNILNVNQNPLANTKIRQRKRNQHRNNIRLNMYNQLGNNNANNNNNNQNQNNLSGNQRNQRNGAQRIQLNNQSNNNVNNNTNNKNNKNMNQNNRNKQNNLSNNLIKVNKDNDIKKSKDDVLNLNKFQNDNDKNVQDREDEKQVLEFNDKNCKDREYEQLVKDLEAEISTENNKIQQSKVKKGKKQQQSKVSKDTTQKELQSLLWQLAPEFGGESNDCFEGKLAKEKQNQINHISEIVEETKTLQGIQNDIIVITGKDIRDPLSLLKKLKYSGIIKKVEKINSEEPEDNYLGIEFNDDWKGTIVFTGNLILNDIPKAVNGVERGSEEYERNLADRIAAIGKNEIIVELFEGLFVNLKKRNNEQKDWQSAPKAAIVAGSKDFLFYGNTDDLKVFKGDSDAIVKVHQNELIRGSGSDGSRQYFFALRALKTKIRSLKVIAEMQKHYIEQVLRENVDITDPDLSIIDKEWKEKTKKYIETCDEMLGYISSNEKQGNAGDLLSNINYLYNALQKSEDQLTQILKELGDRGKGLSGPCLSKLGNDHNILLNRLIVNKQGKKRIANSFAFICKHDYTCEKSKDVLDGFRIPTVFGEKCDKKNCVDKTHFGCGEQDNSNFLHTIDEQNYTQIYNMNTNEKTTGKQLAESNEKQFDRIKKLRQAIREYFNELNKRITDDGIRTIAEQEEFNLDDEEDKKLYDQIVKEEIEKYNDSLKISAEEDKWEQIAERAGFVIESDEDKNRYNQIVDLFTELGRPMRLPEGYKNFWEPLIKAIIDGNDEKAGGLITRQIKNLGHDRWYENDDIVIALQCFNLINSDKQRGNPIRKYSWGDKFWSLGETTARRRRINQLWKIMDECYTRNMDNKREKQWFKRAVEFKRKGKEVAKCLDKMKRIAGQDLLSIARIHSRWSCGCCGRGSVEVMP